MTALGAQHQPAARFDAPAVSVRSVWAGPSRAWWVGAYRRSRNGGVAELRGEAQQQSGRCRRRNRQLLPYPAHEQSRVGRSPSRRRITCRTKVPVMKATTHSETPSAAIALAAPAICGHDYRSCSHVDTHH